MSTRFRNLNLRFNGPESTGSTTPPGGEQPSGDEEQPVVIENQPKPAPPAPAEPTPATDPATEPTPTEVEGSTDGGRTFSADYVEKLRKENAAARVAKKDDIQAQIDAALANGQKEWATQLGKQLGVIKDEEAEADPAKIIATITAERDAAKAEADQFKTERRQRAEADALAKASETAEAHADLVEAVVRSKGLLKDIDPTADDYAAQVAAVVKAEVEQNPKLRVVQVAPRSGGENTPTGDQTTAGDSVEDFRKGRRKRRGLDD